MCFVRCFRSSLLVWLIIVPAWPQSAGNFDALLNRLDTLERQNAALLQEIKDLRATIQQQVQQQASSEERLSERMDAADQKIQDEAQTRLATSERYPMSITGMLLFDTNLVHGSGRGYGETQTDYGEGPVGGHATLSESIIGLQFHGPQVWGAKVHGSLSMDFFGTSNEDFVFRLRRGIASFDWEHRSLMFGQEKPIVAPYEPTSFARVGVPPLAGSGNLWLWTPQVRYEERLGLPGSNQLAVQAGVLATYDAYSPNAYPSGIGVEPVRPAGELRLEIAHLSKTEKRFAIGLSGHASETHIGGVSVPSRVASADVLFKPVQWLQVTGTVLRGSNFSNLGGLPTAVAKRGSELHGVRGTAGWLQLSFPVTSRLTFDAYAGRQTNVARDLGPYQIAGSTTYAGNVLYRIAPNIVVGFEGSHNVLSYLYLQRVLATRYDATIAYLF